MLIQCPGCGVSALPQRFCDNCGTNLDRICTACSVANRPMARFCAHCGTTFPAPSPPADPPLPDAPPAPPLPADLPPAAEHKHVTVLFADICGSTELVADMDPEDASVALGAVLYAMGTAVRRHGGVVNQRLGDGIMALFGAPAAAEDHAARACFAALAIVADVGRMGAQALPVRVGLCSGPVILRRAGRDEGDYEVTGLTAHIASRLEQRAEPGTVLLAPQTAQLAAGIARTERVGAVSLKGLSSPLEAHRLLAASDEPSWVVRSGTRQLSPFVGRARELALLAAALDRAWHGRAQAVALVGDAGMGKSRLVHHVLDTLPPGAWQVVWVETTAQSSAVPYVLLTELLRHVAGCARTEGLAGVAARLPHAIAALGLDPAFDPSPLLLHLGPDGGPALAAAATPEAHRRTLVGRLVPILRRLSELRPLVLVVEDYHWLDTSSVELLHELRRELDPVRLMLLMTTRPERRPGWGTNGGADPSGAAREVELAPVTGPQANAILCDLVGAGPDLAPLRALIVARAGGTPFFLEEFAQSLHEQGILAEGAPSLSDIVIPASVQGILAARIDRLPPLCRHVLQIAAVVGQEVPQALLAAVAGLPAAAMEQAVGVLHATRFLTEGSGPSGAVHSFAHALTQAVAYDALLRADRRALHGRVLRALEALGGDGDGNAVDTLAHHAVCAEAWPEAARYAMQAGERASRRSAPVEARAYLMAAIAALGRQPATLATVSQGIDARLSLRGVATSLTDMAGMHEMLQSTLAEADQLAEQAGDRLALARVYVSRGAMLSHWGDLPGAVELSRTALAMLRTGGDRPGIVGAAFALAQALWYGGDLEAARQVLTDNLAVARSPEGQRRSHATFVLPAVGFLCYLARVHGDLGDPAAGHAAIAEARELATGAGGMFDQVLVDLNEGAVWLAAGETGQAVEALERTLRTARVHGIEWLAPSVACLLGTGWVAMGRNAEARALLEDAAAFSDRNGHVAKRLLCSPPLVRALAGAPHHDLPAARALAERTVRDAGLRGFKPVVQQTHAALQGIAALHPCTG